MIARYLRLVVACRSHCAVRISALSKDGENLRASQIDSQQLPRLDSNGPDLFQPGLAIFEVSHREPVFSATPGWLIAHAYEWRMQ